MAKTSGGLTKRTSSYDSDDLAWLEARGKRLDRSVDWQVREIIRAFRTAEEVAAAPARQPGPRACEVVS